MPRRVNQPPRPGPPDLEDAIKNHTNCGLDGNLPLSGCRRLLSDLHYPPHAPMPYTWGFRIYRTTYGSPDAPNDAGFTRAIEILDEYMRYELFSYSHGESLTLDGAPYDAAQTNAKNVLWRRLRNDIVEDRERLEGASPEKVIDLAREWIPLQYEGAKVSHSSAFRYPLIVDEEVLRNLLALPIPVDRYENSEAATYTIKVCDLRVDDYDPDEEEYMSSDDDDDMLSEPEDDGYRSWIWIGADYLVWLWFEEGNAATEEVCSWVDCPAREERRFLFWRTKLSLGCMHSEAEHRAMYPSLFRDEEGGGLEDVDRPSAATANLTLD